MSRALAMKREAEEDWGVSKRRKDDLQGEAQSLGRPAIVLDVDAVARLLRTMVELEGGQTAFASRHGIEHTTINAILSGKRPVTESVANGSLAHVHRQVSSPLCPPTAFRRPSRSKTSNDGRAGCIGGQAAHQRRSGSRRT